MPLDKPFDPEVSSAKLAADGKVMIVDDEPINIKVRRSSSPLPGTGTLSA